MLYLALICSVVVREDKKLLTVLFPDGCDGRAFTLKVYMFAFWPTRANAKVKLLALWSASWIVVLLLLLHKNIFFLIHRQKLLKTYSSGKQHWKKLLHRLQMQLLWWDIMEYFVMTQQMYTKGLFQIVGALLPLQFILSCGELSIHLFSYISSIDCREREETYQITSCWQANTACTGRYRWQSFFSRKSFAFPWETW